MNKVFFLKLAERVVKSFVGGFAASAVFLHGGAFTMDNLKIALGAGGASVIFGFMGKAVGDSNSPSWLTPAMLGAVGGGAGAAVGGAVGSTLGSTVGGVTGAVGDLGKDIGDALGIGDHKEEKKP